MENPIPKKRRDNILLRLRKIEGQIRGIHRMVEREAECGEILIQVAAVRSAIKRVGSLVIQNYLKDCVEAALDRDRGGVRDGSVDEWITIVSRYMD
ncbi:MAG: metal-sensitive transcriptional regulator [Deltaproteobacteria bacterium]|nr:metal-sensitive transcriptional regulator [Deltaproteobacteria bacterium]MBW2123776.1 metal-sensitive transcriptional regulator [Deltaproteobacteria bacterium]